MQLCYMKNLHRCTFISVNILYTNVWKWFSLTSLNHHLLYVSEKYWQTYTLLHEIIYPTVIDPERRVTQHIIILKKAFVMPRNSLQHLLHSTTVHNYISILHVIIHFSCLGFLLSLHSSHLAPIQPPLTKHCIPLLTHYTSLNRVGGRRKRPYRVHSWPVRKVR